MNGPGKPFAAIGVLAPAVRPVNPWAGRSSVINRYSSAKAVTPAFPSMQGCHGAVNQDHRHTVRIAFVSIMQAGAVCQR